MSKRGGTSEVNGFISINPNDNTVKRKSTVASKKANDEAADRKKASTKGPSQSSTQSGSRVSDGSTKKVSSKTAKDQGGLPSTSLRRKTESGSPKKVESKQLTKKEVTSTSMKSTTRISSQVKPKVSSRDVPSTSKESMRKPKESASSPLILSKGTKPKIIQSNVQLTKRSSLTSKDSPYLGSIAQKTQIRTSTKAAGDTSSKASQLGERSKKPKAPSASKTAANYSKPLLPDTTRHSKKSLSDSSPKTKSSVRKKTGASVKSIPENAESEDTRRPFGEIPRSNTFTKEEGGAPDSLTSEGPSQAHGSSITAPTGDDEYNYEDDFEDYESDFEEYVESESTSITSGTTDVISSSSEEDTLDENGIGGGYSAGPSLRETPSDPPQTSQTSSTSKRETNLKLARESNKDSRSEKVLTVEEERKLDSGSYDLASHADMRRKKQIQEIRSAIDKENSSFTANQFGHGKAKAHAEDEGFVEIYSQESTPTYLDVTQASTDVLINFENARKQQIQEKAKAKVRKRGAVLMEMIKLDVMSFQLLDIPSVPYEVYMQCYGRSDTFQIHTQTNEDAISEDVQTDEILTCTKWTQHPVKYSSPKTSDDLLRIFSQEKLGVGGETTVDENEDWSHSLHINSMRLHNFINNAGELMLTILEECERDRHLELSKTGSNRDFGFSDSFTSLNVGRVDFLKGRPVSMASFSDSNGAQILTVHKASTVPLSIQAESEGRCVLCTWSVREPSCPLQTLVASNDVASVCFHAHLVFAGLVDGIVCLWDLRERSATHCRSHLKPPEWLLRSPTYISANLEKDKRHFSSVVSIKILPESNSDDSAKTTVETPTKLASLDEDGLLIIWSIVETKSSTSIDSGLAPWGRVRLIQSSVLRVLKSFPKTIQRAVQCRCMTVDPLKPNNLYIATNCGEVVHCLQTSARAKPQFYTSSTDARITCMEFSRTGHSLLMVGNSAGRVQVYRTATERPLLDVAASAISPSPPVRSLQWSPAQPGLFFVLDATSCIHVWDLCGSDMGPQMSVPFSDQVITSISLAPQPGTRMLAVAFEAGAVHIYSLKPEFGVLPERESGEQRDIFARYITIL